jgi:hypothetical protein
MSVPFKRASPPLPTRHLLSETKFMNAKRKCEGHTVLGHIQRVDRLFASIRDNMDLYFQKAHGMNSELKRRIHLVGYEQNSTRRHLAHLRSLKR